MKKLLLLFTFLLCVSICNAETYTGDTYRLTLPAYGSSDWHTPLNANFVSIDRVMTILSNDATKRDVEIDILSNDAATQDLKLDILTNDAVTWQSDTIKLNIVSSEIAVISSDAVAWNSDTIRMDIVSAEVNVISGEAVTWNSDTVRINIISADAIDWESTVLLASIISNDAATWNSDTVKLTTVSSDCNDWGIGTTEPKIQFTISDPENLPVYETAGRNDKTVIVWTNDSGLTFTVSKIEAFSDEDNYTFDLLISGGLTDCGLANQASCDSIVCAADGTSVYTDSETTITTAGIGTGKHLMFKHMSGTAGQVKVNIYGSF